MLRAIITIAVLTALVTGMTAAGSVRAGYEVQTVRSGTDGGALHWQDRDFSRWLMSWLSAFYNRAYVENTDRNIDFSNPPFEVATVDLRVPPKGGNPAIVVLWNDLLSCGSAGCTLDIWIDASGQGDYREAGSFLGHDLTLGTGSKGGFRDLWLDGTARLRWNGKAYAR